MTPAFDRAPGQPTAMAAHAAARGGQHAPAAPLVHGVVLAPRCGEAPTLWWDGAVAFAGGRVVSAGPSSPAQGPTPPRLIVPGLVDLHIHWPQFEVRGVWAEALLPWLRDHIWPAEAAVLHTEAAHQRAATFLAALRRAGTVAALTFGPPSLEASRALLAQAWHGIFDGPALMTVHCPAELRLDLPRILTAIEELPPPTRARVAISPRFAPNLLADELAAAGAIANRLGLAVQSHVSENRDEVAWVASLFPEARDYLDVYDRAGLLGPRTMLAHGVHLSDREWAAMEATGTWLAHCPTSNEALGSGRMALERLRETSVPWVLATDVGAGPQVSLLHVMSRAMALHRQAGVTLSASESLARATAWPGRYLAQLDRSLDGLGTFAPGAPAHAVALPLPNDAIERARASDDPAEVLLDAALAGAAPAWEAAPAQVWCWGAPVLADEVRGEQT